MVARRSPRGWKSLIPTSLTQRNKTSHPPVGISRPFHFPYFTCMSAKPFMNPEPIVRPNRAHHNSTNKSCGEKPEAHCSQRVLRQTSISGTNDCFRTSSHLQLAENAGDMVAHRLGT